VELLVAVAARVPPERRWLGDCCRSNRAAAVAPRRRRCQIHSPLGPSSAGASGRRWFRTRRRGSLELPAIVVGGGGSLCVLKIFFFITRCPRNRCRRCFSPAETRRWHLALTCLLLFVSHSVWPIYIIEYNARLRRTPSSCIKEHVSSTPHHFSSYYYYSGRRTAFVCVVLRCRRRVLWTPNRHNKYIIIFLFLALCSLVLCYSTDSDDSGLINVLRFIVVELNL